MKSSEDSSIDSFDQNL